MLPVEFHVSFERSLGITGCVGISQALLKKGRPGGSARTKFHAQLLLQKRFQFIEINPSIVIRICPGKR